MTKGEEIMKKRVRRAETRQKEEGESKKRKKYNVMS